MVPPRGIRLRHERCDRVTVVGMTCGHCVAAVTSEVSKIDGVTNVDVDLASGQVTLHAAHEVDEQAVVAAVDEAGNELTS